MKRKPCSFSLTENAYDALHSLEKHMPSLTRRAVVSLAIESMEQACRGGQPIKPVTPPDNEVVKRKPRHFSLTENAYDALHALEKHMPFLKRGELISLALANMEPACRGGQPIKPVKLPPDMEDVI